MLTVIKYLIAGITLFNLINIILLIVGDKFKLDSLVEFILFNKKIDLIAKAGFITLLAIGFIVLPLYVFIMTH